MQSLWQWELLIIKYNRGNEVHTFYLHLTTDFAEWDSLSPSGLELFRQYSIPSTLHAVTACHESPCFRTRLSLSLSERRDEGTYYCVSKNELGITRGNIQVFSEYLVQSTERGIYYWIKFCWNSPVPGLNFSFFLYFLNNQYSTSQILPGNFGECFN